MSKLISYLLFFTFLLNGYHSKGNNFNSNANDEDNQQKLIEGFVKGFPLINNLQYSTMCNFLSDQQIKDNFAYILNNYLVIILPLQDSLSSIGSKLQQIDQRLKIIEKENENCVLFAEESEVLALKIYNYLSESDYVDRWYKNMKKSELKYEKMYRDINKLYSQKQYYEAGVKAAEFHYSLSFFDYETDGF